MNGKEFRVLLTSQTTMHVITTATLGVHVHLFNYMHRQTEGPLFYKNDQNIQNRIIGIMEDEKER